MSIGPAIIAVPPVNAPGSQAPGSPAPGSPAPSGAPAAGAGGDPGASTHADFASALKNGGPVDPARQVSAQPVAAYRPGTIAPRNTLGDQVLGGLEKLGRSVESMDAWGSPPPATKTAAAKAPSSQGGAQKLGASSPASEMRDLFDAGIRHQSQVYATMFNFELIQETSQSMLKSLKSLLTQGGG